MTLTYPSDVGLALHQWGACLLSIPYRRQENPDRMSYSTGQNVHENSASVPNSETYSSSPDCRSRSHSGRAVGRKIPAASAMPGSYRHSRPSAQHTLEYCPPSCLEYIPNNTLAAPAHSEISFRDHGTSQLFSCSIQRSLICRSKCGMVGLQLTPARLRRRWKIPDDVGR